MALTDTKLKQLKLKEGQSDRYVADGHGLYIRLRDTGARHWVFRYTYAGKRDKVNIGSYPEVSLAQARERRMEQAKILDAGQNPANVKSVAVQTKRDAITVEQLGEEFNERYLQKRYKRPAPAYEALKRDTIRVLKDVLAVDVTSEMLTKKVFNPMVDRDAKVGANRTLGLTRLMFQYGCDQHYLKKNPVIMTKKAVGGREQSKETVLLFDQIKDFLVIMASTENPMSLSTKYAILTVLGTGKRELEVVTAEWAHMDLESGVWLNPGHLTKEGKDHVVYLSQWMVSRLKDLRSLKQSNKWVFPSPQNSEKRKRNTHVTRHALSEAILRLYDDGIIKIKFTPHDLRRTFATRAANLKIGPHVVSKCQDHVMTGMMAVYNLADYFEERKEAMDLWGAKLTELSPPDL